MESRIISTQETDLFVVEAGNKRNPTIVFLHGYPDDHTIWSKQMEALQDSFHVVAFDLRGAGRSSLKTDINGAYRLEKVIDDLATVINEVVGPKSKVHLVGHDWGSVVAWSALTDEGLQKRILSFTSISGPHFGAAVDWLKCNLKSLDPKRILTALKQLGASTYMGVFNLPFIQYSIKLFPRQWATILSKLGGMGASQKWHDGDNKETLVSRFVVPVELYRQNFMPLPRLPGRAAIKVPVQLVVPTKDKFVMPEMVECVEPYATQVKKESIEANHWALQTNAEEVSNLIQRFVESQEKAKPKRKSASKKKAALKKKAAAASKGSAAKKTTTKKTATKKSSAKTTAKKKAAKPKAETNHPPTADQSAASEPTTKSGIPATEASPQSTESSDA